jgi:hypothetical protein
MTKEEFLALAGDRYDALQGLNKLNSFYDYEKQFVHIWQDLGKAVLENNLGAVPTNRRKKNFTTFGQISIDKKNAFSEGNNGFQISPLLQELMVYAGQFDCYARCNEVIKKFMNLEVSSAQVYRVTDLYGEELGKSATTTRTMLPVKQEETLYVEADGSIGLSMLWYILLPNTFPWRGQSSVQGLRFLQCVCSLPLLTIV